MKIASSCTLVILLFTIFGILVAANAAATSDSAKGWSYQRVEGGIEITGYDGSGVEHLIMPRIIDGESVVGIGRNALFNNNDVKTVSIPQGVTYIRREAFGYCFSLITIEIPKSVTSIEENAFGGCATLESIIVESGNARFLIANDALIDKIDRSLIAYPASINKAEFSIPSGVSRIGEMTFEGCNNLISVSIPDSIVSIGKQAFRYCNNLRSIHLPEGLIEIDDQAFYMCKNLNDISIPNSVERIGSDAFGYCESLGFISIPAGVREIGAAAFASTPSLNLIELDVQNEYYEWIDHAIIEKASRKLIAFPSGYRTEEYTIPDNVLSIGDAVFRNNAGIESIVIPNGVMTLDDRVFWGSYSIRSVSFADSVIDMGERTFEYSEIESIRFSAGLAEIKENTFFNNINLKSIKIPEGVVFIGRSSFASCYGLEDVEISSSVITIDDCAFESCSVLSRVLIPASVMQIGESVFANCSDTLILLGTEGSYAQSYAQENGLTFQAVYDEYDNPAELLSAIHDAGINLTISTIVDILHHKKANNSPLTARSPPL